MCTESDEQDQQDPVIAPLTLGDVVVILFLACLFAALFPAAQGD